jgi:hypothetical protein
MSCWRIIIAHSTSLSTVAFRTSEGEWGVDGSKIFEPFGTGMMAFESGSRQSALCFVEFLGQHLPDAEAEAGWQFESLLVG